MPGNKTKVTLAAGDWGHAIPVAVANIWAVLRNRFPVGSAATNSGSGGGSSGGGGTVNVGNGVGSKWTLTASGPFTAPVTGQYSVKTIGGGGGGAPSRVISGYYYYGITKAAGNPGGAGEVKTTTISLTGGQTVVATVGNGGVNVNGGLTSFGAYITSLGGLFGSGTQYNGESYGAGGIGGVPNLSSATPDQGGAGQQGAIIITRVA